jgi:hypothetical protein
LCLQHKYVCCRIKYSVVTCISFVAGLKTRVAKNKTYVAEAYGITATDDLFVAAGKIKLQNPKY